MKDPQPNLKLEYSKVIKPMWVFPYQEYRKTRQTIKGITTPRKIQMYRWWFRYLQLALELETHGVVFTPQGVRPPRNRKKKTKGKYKDEKVVVNRDRYEGWDLDEVLTSNFDKWWKDHSGLFVETPTQTMEILDKDDLVFEDHYRYFRIDTRTRTIDTIKSLRQQLDPGRRSSKWTSKWFPTGEVRQEKLLNNYNTLVMWLKGKTTKEILSSGLFRTSHGQEIEYQEDIGFRGRKVSSKKNLDRMYELLGPSKLFVMTVCDGYFANHPRNKRYFGK